jgi:hypothetical protein
MGVKDKALGVAGRFRAPATHDLRKRVAALEAEVQECRQLNLRLAELTDLVTDLLVPLARSDEAGMRDVLAKYQESI